MVFVDPEGMNIPRCNAGNGAAGEAFQSESFQYLMGKTVKETVTSEDGSFRIEAGTVLVRRYCGRRRGTTAYCWR